MRYPVGTVVRAVRADGTEIVGVVDGALIRHGAQHIEVEVSNTSDWAASTTRWVEYSMLSGEPPRGSRRRWGVPSKINYLSAMTSVVAVTDHETLGAHAGASAAVLSAERRADGRR